LVTLHCARLAIVSRELNGKPANWVYPPLKTRLTSTKIWLSLRFNGHYLKIGKGSLMANM